jgi:hypothetical protein
MVRSRCSILVVSTLFILAAGLQADTIQLVNGDSVSGKVVSLDDKQLKLQSDILGQMSIERSKIAAIHFGDAAVPKKSAVAAKPAGPLDVKDLLRGGIDPQTMNEIKKTFPLLATPEASKYFENAVTGLMTGSLNVQDVRKDAIKAVGEIKKLEKELGPQVGQALQGYLGILEHFLRETEPAKQAPKAPATADKQKK